MSHSMPIKHFTTHCHCATVNVEIWLSSVPSGLSPRICDCVFCTQRDVAYASDPWGQVEIRVVAREQLLIERQGDGLAEFISCAECASLLAVRWKNYSSVNARLFRGVIPFGAEIVVSPKQLTADHKVARWKRSWFPKLAILKKE